MVVKTGGLHPLSKKSFSALAVCIDVIHQHQLTNDKQVCKR